MNLRQKNKRLKWELELSKQRVCYLEKVCSAYRRDLVARERMEIDTLTCFRKDIADRHDSPLEYERYIYDALTHELSRELAKYIEVKKHTYHGELYPMDVYEATVRVVRPRHKHDGLTASIQLIDEMEGAVE